MPCILNHLRSANAPSFYQLYQPIQKAMIAMPPLEARGHRHLKMTFEEQLKALIFFHLEEHTSVQHLQTQVVSILPKEHDKLGDLIGIDGSLIDACLSMHWLTTEKELKKPKCILALT